MVWAIILLFFLSGICAYFTLKANIRYRYKILFNSCILIISFILLIISNISDLSVLLYVLLFMIVCMGIIIHFIFPLILNIVGICFSKQTRHSYSLKTYNEHLNNGHRMYFCVLLFTTFKIFLLVMFIASCFNMIK